MKERQNFLPNLLVTILFGVIITSGIWGMLIGGAFPKLELETPLTDYPKAYEAVFQEEFPHRYQMIRLSRLVRNHVFGERFFQMVIIADQGWLHLNQAVSTDLCQNLTHQLSSNLNLVSTKLGQAQQTLESQGIGFAVAIIPEKCRVYPEYIRTYLPLLNQQSYSETLLTKVTTQTDVSMIDLAGPLVAAKQDHQVFMATDTHWTPIGAYLAYQQLHTLISSQIPISDPIEWDASRDTITRETTSDLGQSSMLPEYLSEQISLPDVNYLEMETTSSGAYRYHNPGADNEFTLLVFEDSFMTVKPIQPFLAQHFSNSIFLNINEGFLWSSDPGDLAQTIQEWDPDMILILYVDRNLYLLRK